MTTVAVDDVDRDAEAGGEDPAEATDPAALEQWLQRSHVLADLTQRAIEGLAFDDLLQEVCSRTRELLDTDYCDVFELRPEESELELRAGVGWPEAAHGEARLDATAGSQSAYTVQSWEPTVVGDIRDDERFRRPPLYEDAGVLSSVTAVIPSPGHPWGVFGVHSTQPHAFDEMDQAFVLSMSHILSQAIAQRRIEQEKQRFASIVDEVEEYAIFDCDAEGHVRSWNQGAGRIFGYTEDEIVGEHLRAFCSDEEQEARTAEENLRRAREQGSAQDEGWRERKDGSPFWVSETIQARRDPDGGLGGFSVIVRDRTDQMEHELELERSERRYRTLVENFPHGAVGLFDADLVYRAVGGELSDVVGADGPRDQVGKTIHELYPEKLAEALEPRYRSALEGEPASFTIEAFERHLLVRTLPVRDSEGEIFAGMAMSQDLTDRIEYRQKLEESNEQLESFAYAASHDLQEPLRMVTSYLDLVDARYRDRLDEEGRDFIEHAADGAERMSRMIDSLLDYACIATEGRELVTTDAQAVLEDALHDLRFEIEDTDAEVTTEAMPAVKADPDQLGQVFRNLLANALKYSGDEAPRIHVGAEPVEGRWRFSVEDEGVGIAGDAVEDIFEVFWRAEAHQEHGTGIGLAICRRIVERHGGETWVDSEPGAGSTFFFTMPAVGAPEPPPNIGLGDEAIHEEDQAP